MYNSTVGVETTSGSMVKAVDAMMLHSGLMHNCAPFNPAHRSLVEGEKIVAKVNVQTQELCHLFCNTLFCNSFSCSHFTNWRYNFQVKLCSEVNRYKMFSLSCHPEKGLFLSGSTKADWDFQTQFHHFLHFHFPQ